MYSCDVRCTLHVLWASNVSVRMMCCGFLFFIFVVESALGDNLALLSETLRTYERVACDDHLVTLKCPPGTCISVQVARYGSSAHTLSALCPDKLKNNLTCLFPTVTQTKWEAAPEGNWGKYSLLQTVVEACHKKRQCKFHISPNANNADPCPGLRKYIEVAYKCRPYEFRSKVACQGELMELECNPYTRVAVYSASFGRTEYETVRCLQPQGVREETCLVSYATETVMQICHGKRHCSISADATTFGNPCREHSRMYLKVVYTCVPRSVLRDHYDEVVEQDEGSETEYEVDGYESVDNALRESHIYSESPKMAVAKEPPGNVTSPKLSRPTQRTNDGDQFQKERERLLLYLSLGVCGSLLAIMLIVTGRLLWQRRTYRRHTTRTSKAASREGSVQDTEIDLTMTGPVTVLESPDHSPTEVIRYGDETSDRSKRDSDRNHYG